MSPIEGCTHRVQHQHGTSTAYSVCACRCTACAKAERRRRKTSHRRPRLSSAPVRDHLEVLVMSGMTLHEIGVRAGLSRPTVKWVWEHERVSPRVAAALLRVSGLTLVGIRRRVEALQAIGWTMAEVEQRAGLSRGGGTRIINAQRRPTAATMEGIVRAYSAMWEGPEAPNAISLRRSRAKGWVPPMAWDDDTIDDPRVQPQGMEHEAPLTRDEFADELLRLAQMGRSWGETLTRFRLTPVAVERRLHRVGRWAEVSVAFGIRERVAA